MKRISEVTSTEYFRMMSWSILQMKIRLKEVKAKQSG
jgi:hypothetical protein